jgi:hypothetical protein
MVIATSANALSIENNHVAMMFTQDGRQYLKQNASNGESKHFFAYAENLIHIKQFSGIKTS